MLINHFKKGVGMKIKDNLNAAERKFVKEIISDQSIVICPAGNCHRRPGLLFIQDATTTLNRQSEGENSFRQIA